jgi:hypothetical protein
LVALLWWLPWWTVIDLCQHHLVLTQYLYDNVPVATTMQRKLPVGPALEEWFQLAHKLIDQGLYCGGH